MRPVIGCAVLLTVSLVAYGQNRGGGPSGRGFQPRVYATQQTTQYRTYGSPTGFGNVLFPGTGSPPPAGAPFTTFPFSNPTTFVERLGSSISGTGYTGVGPGHRRGGRGGGVVAYPVYIGGGFYGDPSQYDNQYGNQQQAPNITIVMPPQQPAAPVVMQYGPEQAGPAPTAEAAPPVNSNVQIYQAPSPPRPEPAADDQVLFFVALKDSSVYTAVAYWVEDGTLHYITPQGRHNQVSIDLVDRPTSTKLNEGRKVEFRLPAPR